VVVREEPTRHGSGARGGSTDRCREATRVGSGLMASEAPIHARDLFGAGPPADRGICGRRGSRSHKPSLVSSGVSERRRCARCTACGARHAAVRKKTWFVGCIPSKEKKVSRTPLPLSSLSPRGEEDGKEKGWGPMWARGCCAWAGRPCLRTRRGAHKERKDRPKQRPEMKERQTPPKRGFVKRSSVGKTKNYYTAETLEIRARRLSLLGLRKATARANGRRARKA